MIWVIAILSVLALYAFFSAWAASRKLRKYQTMLDAITQEEVYERAQKFMPYTLEQAMDGIEPPLVRAIEEIFAEKKGQL